MFKKSAYNYYRQWITIEQQYYNIVRDPWPTCQAQAGYLVGGILIKIIIENSKNV